MGGDHAPGEIVAGARRLPTSSASRWSSSGPRPGRRHAAASRSSPASEVIAMDEDPGRRCGARRTPRWCGPPRRCATGGPGHGQRRQHRGDHGDALAAHGPAQGCGRVRPSPRRSPSPARTPAVLLDAGANAECTPAMLVQFAQMGAAYVVGPLRHRAPEVGLLSIGEEKSKGTPLVKEAHALLAEAPGLHFVGNVEGRDLLRAARRRGRDRRLHRQRRAQDPRGVAAVPHGHPARGLRRRRGDRGGRRGAPAPPAARSAAEFDPDGTGGAMLLGVDGVCVISHGSSSATAIVCRAGGPRRWPSPGLVEAIGQAVAAG